MFFTCVSLVQSESLRLEATCQTPLTSRLLLYVHYRNTLSEVTEHIHNQIIKPTLTTKRTHSHLKTSKLLTVMKLKRLSRKVFFRSSLLGIHALLNIKCNKICIMGKKGVSVSLSEKLIYYVLKFDHQAQLTFKTFAIKEI